MGTPDPITVQPPEQLAELVGAAVRAHPAVTAVDGGPFGTIATHAPGRTVAGVHVDPDGRTVAVGVVLVLTGTPLPEIIGGLRDVVRSVAGDVRVDVTVSDIAQELR